MWTITGNILLASMWKLYMQAYSEAIYGTKPLNNTKEKQ